MANVEDNFAEYMREALYGEDGFYTKGGGAGRTRDYLTSPEVGDLFGRVIAGYIYEWHKSIDHENAIVLDVGCGPGSLAASIARSGIIDELDLEYHLVDISPKHRETAKQKLSALQPAFAWSIHDEIPACDVPTLVIANELLDNLVFDIAYTHDVYKSEQGPDLSQTPLAALGMSKNTGHSSIATVPHDIGNFRIPIHVGMQDFFEQLEHATMQVSSLWLLVFDYIKSVTKFSDEQWLRLYSNNRRIVGVDEVLNALDSGAKGDITTDVTLEDLGALLEGYGFSKVKMSDQSQWLLANGIDGFVTFSNKSQSNYDKVASFVTGGDSSSGFENERATLTDPAGLGAFTVVTAVRET